MIMLLLNLFVLTLSVNGESLENSNKLEMKYSIFTKKSKNLENPNKLEMNYAIFTKKLADNVDATIAMIDFKDDIVNHPEKLYPCAEKFLLSEVYFTGIFKQNLNNNKNNFYFQRKSLALLIAKIKNQQYNILLVKYYYKNYYPSKKILTNDEQVEIVIRKLIHPGQIYILENKLTEKDIKINISINEDEKTKNKLTINSSWRSGRLAGASFRTVLEKRKNYWIPVKHEIISID
jgi:hypothetical protein